MPTITPTIALLFVGALVFQIAGIAVMPMTKGFTIPLPSLISGACFVIGVFLMARLSNTGADLGILIPLMGAVMQLSLIAVGIVFYGESASLMRVGMLVTACLLIGSATMV